MKVIILRHAESKKNLSETIGGKGASLTVRGRRGIMRTALRIGARREKFSHIYCAPTVQTIETGHYIKSSVQGCQLVIERLLNPIKLGNLSGSNVSNARKNSVEDLKSLESWNNNLIEIAGVSIKGMQSPWDFYRSGLDFLLELNRTTRYACVVATRSSLILLWHIKQRNTPDPGGGYINKKFPYHRPIILNFARQDILWMRGQIEKNGIFPSSMF